MGAELVCTGCNACQGCYATCDVCNVCQSCNVCEKCNTCEDCDGCQDCNSCQSCNAQCNSQGCNTEQTFCTIECETYGEYSNNFFEFSYRPFANIGIMGPDYFNQSVWNEIIAYINKMLAKGSEQNSGPQISDSTAAAVAPFSAEEFNRIATKAGSTLSVKPGDVIYGAYFQDLEKAVIKQKLSAIACDKCNIECDVTCDGCQKCNDQNTDCCDISVQMCIQSKPEACNQSNGHICGQTITVCCGCNSCNICLVCVTGEDSGDNDDSLR